MNNTNTADLEYFLDKNNIKYEKKYNKNDNRLNYNLQQNFDIGRYYSVQITVYDNGNEMTTFEYDSEKYNYVSTILFEEHCKWKDINKKFLFQIILEHMASYIESDNE